MKNKPQNKTWSDELAQRFNDRGIKHQNIQEEKHVNATHESMMEINSKTLAPINHARLCKRMTPMQINWVNRE